MLEPNQDRANWDNALLRLRNVAHTECRGHAATVMHWTAVLVDGKLEMWSRPTVTHFEPWANREDGMHRLIAALDGMGEGMVVETGEGDGED